MAASRIHIRIRKLNGEPLEFQTTAEDLNKMRIKDLKVKIWEEQARDIPLCAVKLCLGERSLEDGEAVPHPHPEEELLLLQAVPTLRELLERAEEEWKVICSVRLLVPKLSERDCELPLKFSTLEEVFNCLVRILNDSKLKSSADLLDVLAFALLRHPGEERGSVIGWLERLQEKVRHQTNKRKLGELVSKLQGQGGGESPTHESPKHNMAPGTTEPNRMRMRMRIAEEEEEHEERPVEKFSHGDVLSQLILELMNCPFCKHHMTPHFEKEAEHLAHSTPLPGQMWLQVRDTLMHEICKRAGVATIQELQSAVMTLHEALHSEMAFHYTAEPTEVWMSLYNVLSYLLEEQQWRAQQQEMMGWMVYPVASPWEVTQCGR